MPKSLIRLNDTIIRINDLESDYTNNVADNLGEIEISLYIDSKEDTNEIIKDVERLDKSDDDEILIDQFENIYRIKISDLKAYLSNFSFDSYDKELDDFNAVFLGTLELDITK